MSLLDELSGAVITVVDEDGRLVYCWYGGTGVNVYNEDGTEIDYFTVGGTSKLTPARVRAAINRMIAYHRES